MPENKDIKNIHAYFSGMVQGVGFRFVARDLAFRYKIKGWVKNLSDGRVEMLIQGKGKDLDGFLKNLQAEFKNHISDSEFQEPAQIEEHDSFRILF